MVNYVFTFISLKIDTYINNLFITDHLFVPYFVSIILEGKRKIHIGAHKYNFT